MKRREFIKKSATAAALTAIPAAVVAKQSDKSLTDRETQQQAETINDDNQFWGSISSPNLKGRRWTKKELNTLINRRRTEAIKAFSPSQIQTTTSP